MPLIEPDKKYKLKYNNDLNYIPMPKLKGRQQDLFFAVLSQIKEKKDSQGFLTNFFDKEKRKLTIPYAEFVKICRIDDWNRNFTEIWYEIKDFLDILTSFKIEYQTQFRYYNFVCFEEAMHDTQEQTINITFQSRFYDMIVNYKYGFTSFELSEFISLESKYSKILYRLLKQFKYTGYFKIEWQEFCNLMQIPKSYNQSDIDKQILKPAMNELSKSRILDEQERTPFKNIKYDKIKGCGRGRGGKVIGIEFTFDKETKETTNKRQTRNSKNLITKHIEPNLDLYIGKLISTEFGNARILNAEKHNNDKIKVTYSLTKSNEIKFELFNSITELEREIEYMQEKIKETELSKSAFAKLNDLTKRKKINQ
ncbi:MAG: replication initiation protein [Campylobacter sp.]|nr:replication initiation protein [Campylobacter sp.]